MSGAAGWRWRTIQSAPRFYRALADRPLETALPIESWTTTCRDVTGPLIPARLIAAVPDAMRHPVLGSPIWKILLVLVITLPAIAALAFWHRLLGAGARDSRLDQFWRQMLSAYSCIAVLLALEALVFEVNLSGPFAKAVESAGTLLFFLALAWSVWILATEEDLAEAGAERLSAEARPDEGAAEVTATPDRQPSAASARWGGRDVVDVPPARF